jgi:peptidoglycan-N-acetylglucosamine deacetylase
LKVALTFDAEHPDRPNCAPGTADALLDSLADRGIRTTFFMQGRWVEAYPATARRVADEGHQVASHSHHHARMPLLSRDGMVEDIRAAERAIQTLVGADPRPWFRCPWGEGWDDALVGDVLNELGYRHAGWDLEVHDWEPGRTPVALTRSVTKLVTGAWSRGIDPIVLLHSWPEQLRFALPEMVDRLLEEGAEFVRLDELRRITPMGIEDWDGVT